MHVLRAPTCTCLLARKLLPNSTNTACLIPTPAALTALQAHAAGGVRAARNQLHGDAAGPLEALGLHAG